MRKPSMLRPRTVAANGGDPGAGRQRFMVATIIDAMGSGLWMPFALLFFVRAQGIPLVGAGAALSAGGLIGLSLVPLAGTLTDKFGLISLLVSCNIIRFVGFCCYPFATRIWQVAAISAVIAFGDRLFWTANTPMVSALARGRGAEQLIGTQTIARFAGAGIGSGAVAVLPALSGKDLYHLLAYLNAASFAVAAALIMGLRTPRQAACGPAETGQRTGTWVTLLRHPGYVRLCATHTLFTTASYSKYSMLAIVTITVLHGPRWIPGTAVVVGTTVIIIGQRPVTSYFSRRSRTAALMLAATIFAVSFASLAPLTGMPEGAAAAVILTYSAAASVAEAIFAPVAVAAAASVAPPTIQGKASALFQLSWGVSQVTTPLLLTALLSAGNAVLWLTLSALSAMAVLAIWLQRGLLAA
jgi:predicted MFS family arabinose efflux permease